LAEGGGNWLKVAAEGEGSKQATVKGDTVKSKDAMAKVRG
jgi:hypothetical protein